MENMPEETKSNQSESGIKGCQVQLSDLTLTVQK
jgi:hypothetical protein